MNICVFASGAGSNFKNILEARKNGIINSDVILLITNNSKCGAVEIADSYGVEVFHISRKVFTDLSDDDYADLFLQKLKQKKIDLIVLAGYMKMLDLKVIREYENKIINIHPALLPAFGGKGMYGINVHKAVIEAKEKKSGVTIHIVNERYDEGKILFQKSVEVLDSDDEFSLQKKVLILEHKYYPLVIKDIEQNKIIL